MTELSEFEEQLPAQLERLSQQVGRGAVSRSGIDRRRAERARRRRFRRGVASGAVVMAMVAVAGAATLSGGTDGDTRNVKVATAPFVEPGPAGPSSTQSPTPSVVPPAPSTTQPVEPVETTPPSTRSPVNTSIPPLPPKPTGPRVQFTMPSGNIGCTMQSDGGVVRCDIRQRDWAPPVKPADCEYDFGQGLILGGTAFFVCASDTALIGAPVLPYGSTARQGKYECRSDEVGVTCTNLESGHGFLLSAAEYRLF
jgi:hypothetical protein